MPIEHITQTDPYYPEQLKKYLKTEAPEIIWNRGNIDLLSSHVPCQHGDLWAIFCSSKCPGEIILKIHDLAQRFRRLGVSTIGGFHSPVEKECLRVLLRGEQPIIICPARSVENMRLKSEWKRGLSESRLLILSIFAGKFRRSTLELARQRNKFVAALADRIFVAHAAEGSRTLEFAEMVAEWGKPLFTFDAKANKSLFQSGAHPIEPTVETHNQASDQRTNSECDRNPTEIL